MNSSILILGASGYLGGRLSRFLIQKDYSVCLHARRTSLLREYFQNKPATFLEADITNPDFVDLIKTINPEIIINTISLNHHATGKDIHQTHRVNVAPNLEILDTLTKCNSRFKKYIYISTQQVYGKTEDLNITENSICKPSNLYGLTHLLGEEIVSYYHSQSDIASVNLRLSNSFGAPLFLQNDCWWPVLNNFCKTSFDSGTIRIESDGTPQRNFIHIDDFCRAVQIFIETPKNNLFYDCYNVGGMMTYTIAEAAKMVAEVYQGKYSKPMKIINKEGRLFEVSNSSQKPRFVYNISRLQKLGFETERSLFEGIREVFDFLEDRK